MTFLTVDQLGALGKKCHRCDKRSTWIASADWPAYCDDHFPYYEEKPFSLEKNGWESNSQ